MSINHFSSDQIPEAHMYWSPYMMEHSSPNHNSAFTSRPVTKTMNYWAAAAAGGGSASAAMFNLNNEDEEEAAPVDERMAADIDEGMIPTEPLFEKPLTPSDVGKLNRLVIPKQHAEKYFPLSSGGGGDAGEKGFLLSFEDEVGKSWRFRYSYWNSSQSYVLTKGWSRFVKEKKLDAGDFVLFSRHRFDSTRLFIGWRRRNSGLGSGGAQPVACGGGYNPGMFYHHGINNPHPNHHHLSSSYNPYQTQCHHAVFQGQTASSSSASGSWKKLRLFGVNLECRADESEPSTPTESSSSAVSRLGEPPRHHHQFHSNYHQSQTDIKFSLGEGGYHRR